MMFSGKVLLVVFILLIFAMPAYAQFTFPPRPGCSADQTSICDVTATCDLNECKDTYENCQICEPVLRQCPDGSTASCESFCEEAQFGLSAGCTTCVPECGDGPEIPIIILPFDVLKLKPLSVSVVPENRIVPIGDQASYTIAIKNSNPFQINLGSDITVPDGWTKSETQQIQLPANGQGELAVSIASPDNIIEGPYALTAAFFTPDIREPLGFTTVSFTYTAANFQIHSVNIDQVVQQGIPGETLTYNIDITNNDPADFSPGRFELSAAVPESWSATFSSVSSEIRPGETKKISMNIASSDDAEEGSYAANIDVKRGETVIDSSVTYIVSFCGDNICDPGEETPCSEDCQSSRFICGNRCEQKTDVGIDFNTRIQNFLHTKFIVCKHGSSSCESDFERDNCGFDSSCYCGSRFGTSCSMRCVDEKSAYYMLAKDADGDLIRSGSYSFTCPFVDMPEIIQLHSDFQSALDEYEKSRSILEQRAAAGERREELQPCIDGLGIIIDIVAEHANFLDGVVDNPAISNTTLARELTENIRKDIRNTYKSFCRGATGLLAIDSLTPPQSTETDRVAAANAVVKNLGSVDYYGYTTCTFTSPSGITTEDVDSCARIGGSGQKVFRPSMTTSEVGAWNVGCSVFGSLDNQCRAPTLHYESEDVSFSVYSRDVFVQAVSGTCKVGTELKCSVDISSQSACARCRIGGVGCSYVGKNENVLEFSCPAQLAVPGNVEITGYVYETQDCAPAEPAEKSVNVRCE